MSVLLAVLPLISIGSTDDSELDDSLRSIVVDALLMLWLLSMLNFALLSFCCAFVFFEFSSSF